MRTIHRLTSYLFAIISLAALPACDNDAPSRYTVDDLKALPEAALIVPGGEIFRTKEEPGHRQIGPSSTRYTFEVRTDLEAKEIFEFYRSELSERGWRFDRGSAGPGLLLSAGGFKEPFGASLWVPDPATAHDSSDWNGRRSVYELVFSPLRDKQK